MSLQNHKIWAQGQKQNSIDSWDVRLRQHLSSVKITGKRERLVPFFYWSPDTFWCNLGQYNLMVNDANWDQQAMKDC
jgi:hypothetical protein